MDLVKFHNLSKNYKKVQALRNVSGSIKKGRIVGLLGKNGAGKSTFLQCLIGFTKFQGEIEINGQKINYMNEKIFEDIAFIPDVNSLDERVRVDNFIKFFRGIHPRWNEDRFQSLFSKSELPLKSKVKTLSKGMKTKLYLILLLSLDVSFLILDEPTIGLDIVYKNEFYNTILSSFYNENRTIIISTHEIKEVEHILHDLIIIDSGKMLVNDSLDNLLSHYKLITIDSKKRDLLEGIPHKIVTEGISALEVVVPRNSEISGFEEGFPSLDQIFLYILENKVEK